MSEAKKQPADPEMRMHCCRSMTEHIWYEAEDERLIFYSEQRNEYGLQDRKDQEAYTPISFCPWCGKRLPSSLPGEPDKPFE